MPGCWILSLHLLFQLNNNLVKNKIMKKVMLLGDFYKLNP